MTFCAIWSTRLVIENGHMALISAAGVDWTVSHRTAKHHRGREATTVYRLLLISFAHLRCFGNGEHSRIETGSVMRVRWLWICLL